MFCNNCGELLNEYDQCLNGCHMKAAPLVDGDEWGHPEDVDCVGEC